MPGAPRRGVHDLAGQEREPEQDDREVSTAFNGRKFAIDVGATSRPKIHSTAQRPPASRRYIRAEREDLTIATQAPPRSRWMTLCSTETWKIPSTIASEP